MVMQETMPFEIPMAGIISKQVDTGIKLGDLSPIIPMEELPERCQQKHPRIVFSGMALMEMEFSIKHAMLVKDCLALDLVDDLIDQYGQRGIATDIDQYIGLLTS